MFCDEGWYGPIDLDHFVKSWGLKVREASTYKEQRAGGQSRREKERPCPAGLREKIYVCLDALKAGEQGWVGKETRADREAGNGGRGRNLGRRKE